MNSFRYRAVKLWDYAEAIARGELRELAPLLILLTKEKEEEELAMLRDAGIVQDWINEGIEKGKLQGQIATLQSDIIEVLTERFGVLKKACRPGASHPMRYIPGAFRIAARLHRPPIAPARSPAALRPSRHRRS